MNNIGDGKYAVLEFIDNYEDELLLLISNILKYDTVSILSVVVWLEGKKQFFDTQQKKNRICRYFQRVSDPLFLTSYLVLISV